MPEAISGSAVAHTIQLAIAPVFLLAGIGAFLNVIAGRLARVVDRARVLEALHSQSHDDERRRYVLELQTLERRMSLASRSIYLGTASGLVVCLLVITLFFGEIIKFNLGNVVAALFILAITLLGASMIMFLSETRIALRSLHVREDLLRLER